MSLFDELDHDCTVYGLSCQIINNNSKTYVKISMCAGNFADAALWQYKSNAIIQKYFPKASYVTSTKDNNTHMNSTTYCIGDILEILKS